MAHIRDDTRPAPAVARMTVTESLILEARDPVVFANTAVGSGRQRVVFETAQAIQPGTTVAVVVTVTGPPA